MSENIFIIIPAYNEAKNIQTTLNELLKYPYQIVVVDDGSSDNTLNLIKNLPIKILSHQINRGQGAALSTGTTYALNQNAHIIVHFDADGQFLAQEIDTLIQPLIQNKADIILGSRYLQINQSIPFFKKYFIHPLAKIINHFFTGLKLSDVHCGFRAFNNLAGQKIKISVDGMAHATEIIAQIKKNNLRYQEMPITVIYKNFGQGIGGGLKIIKDLILNKFLIL